MELSRRQALGSGLAATIAGGARSAVAIEHPAPDVAHSLLWYDKPAAQWVEALPIGNGRLGAMVFGGARIERIALNEDTLWTGGPYDNVNPAARANLPKIREMIFGGHYAEAEALANAGIQATPRREMSYQSLGDLTLTLPGDGEAGDYRRELDIDAALCRTRFTIGGRRYVREAIASPVDQVIAIAMRAEEGPLDLDIALATGQPGAIAAEGPDVLRLAGTNMAEHDNPGRLHFTCRVKIVPQGGTCRATQAGLSVRGARAVLILVVAATSHRGADDVSGDPDRLTADTLAQASGKSFAALAQAHSAEHRRLFRAASLDLGRGPDADKPTDARVAGFAASPDPALAALYFHYGRYLLICASRPGSQPANLQGIWNASNAPPWGSKFTININTEMNYWPAEPTGLQECVRPLIAMVRELAASGARTAREMYGARGWVAHHNTDLWRASGPVDGARTGLWPCGGAWLATHLWTHYDYGRDEAYLADVYPLIRDASLFFLDTLQADPGSGALVTCPSLSPENDHGRGSTLCAGPAMDMQILRDLFGQAIAAAEILGRDPELRAQFATARGRLAPSRIGHAGQLQEWQEDWDMTAADIHHRHVSHLYGLFPSHQINLDETPGLARAARTSLEMRGDEATGWGIGWRLNLWARLREGDHAHRVLASLLTPGRTYPNMFDAHPPFQIDGNFGGVSGIVEMLVQSRGDLVDLLPALPTLWPTGRIRGIRTHGATTVDLAWRDGRVDSVTLASAIGGRRTVRAHGRSLDITLAPGIPRRIAGTRFA